MTVPSKYEPSLNNEQLLTQPIMKLGLVQEKMEDYSHSGSKFMEPLDVDGFFVCLKGEGFFSVYQALMSAFKTFHNWKKPKLQQVALEQVVRYGNDISHITWKACTYCNLEIDFL